MRRRTVLAFLGAASVSLDIRAPAGAQSASRTPWIGFLGPVSDNPNVAAFRRGLRDRGWIEGQNLLVEYRWAQADQRVADAHAVELATMGLDLIVAPGAGAYDAARRATSILPIVFCTHGDPIGAGHVESLARPAGT